MLVTKKRHCSLGSLAVPMAVWAGWGVAVGKGGRAPTIRKKYKILDKIDAINERICLCLFAARDALSMQPVIPRADLRECAHVGREATRALASSLAAEVEIVQRLQLGVQPKGAARLRACAQSSQIYHHAVHDRGVLRRLRLRSRVCLEAIRQAANPRRHLQAFPRTLLSRAL